MLFSTFRSGARKVKKGAARRTPELLPSGKDDRKSGTIRMTSAIAIAIRMAPDPWRRGSDHRNGTGIDQLDGR
jgi:hypothetical protein